SRRLDVCLAPSRLPVLQLDRMGHSGHFGFLATQTSAPNSMIAWLNRHALLPFFGTSAAARDQIRRCRLPVRRCRLSPRNTLPITLATLVSTAGTGFSYAKDATAPAV